MSDRYPLRSRAAAISVKPEPKKHTEKKGTAVAIHRYPLRNRAAVGGFTPTPEIESREGKASGVSHQRKKCFHCGHVSSRKHLKKRLPDRNNCEKCHKLRDHPGKEGGGRAGLKGYAFRRLKNGKKDHDNKKDVGN